MNLHTNSSRKLEAVRYEKRTWGYPIALETVTLIYNKRLPGAPPKREDESETSRGDNYSLGLQERLLLVGGS
jgi:maltose-binding protein MalE